MKVLVRSGGIGVPLFSLTSSRSWGIGEFADLPLLARWAASAGQSVVQILPITELPVGETSPYSSMTAMALDANYISLPQMADFTAIGGLAAFDTDDRASLAQVQAAPRIAYRDVRALKQRWLRRSFEHFVQAELAHDSARSRQFAAFVQTESWWLDDYAVFHALSHLYDGRHWSEWLPALRTPDAATLARLRLALQNDIAYCNYVQWIAAGQWAEARRQSHPTRIFGDLPFMISGNSADVWHRQSQFMLDASVGAPPDAFSDTGQDWGLPPWRAEVMAADQFAWMRARARRYADLFDGFRLDHLVGLYRTYVRPREALHAASFVPSEPDEQLHLGETIVSLFVESGAEIIAEDLGVIPDFVRASIMRLGVPGFKVLRWERYWHDEGQPPIATTDFAELSVATTGTHDVAPLVALALEGPQAGAPPEVASAEAERFRQHEVQRLLEARSYLTLLPIQDVFGWPDRVNTPNVVDGVNWTWRVPVPVDAWPAWPEAVARAQELQRLTRASQRCPIADKHA